VAQVLFVGDTSHNNNTTKNNNINTKSNNNKHAQEQRNQSKKREAYLGVARGGVRVGVHRGRLLKLTRVGLLDVDKRGCGCECVTLSRGNAWEPRIDNQRHWT
jgi:hypothetical protein